MAIVTITHEDLNSGSPIKVQTKSIKVNGSVNLDAEPSLTGAPPVEVHTQTSENLRYTVVGTLTNETSPTRTLLWDDLLTLYKTKYNGSNHVTLNITYGDSTTLKGLTGSADIKVWLRKPSLDLNAGSVRDAEFQDISLEFIETG